jgi:hypothetical protein
MEVFLLPWPWAADRLMPSAAPFTAPIAALPLLGIAALVAR